MKEKEQIALSVIIPVFNEEENINELHERLKKSLKNISDNYEIIFINDGSTDRTLSILINLSENNKRIKYINFSRNFGHQLAITAGIDRCLGAVTVIMDGDLQDPPELIQKLYNKYISGYNIVSAKRKLRKGETIFKRISATIFYRILKLFTNIRIPVDTGDFKLIDKKVVDYLRQMPEKNKFLRGQIAWLGFKQGSVKFEREKRKFGKTGYSFKKMVDFAIDGITAFSDVPLKFVSLLGFSVSLIAFFIILYALFSYFVWNKVTMGWTSVIISSMFIGGIQLISIGIVGEYISRINNNLQNRPPYIIESTNIEKQ